jgi:outer membrane protein assembly factor BamB
MSIFLLRSVWATVALGALAVGSYGDTFEADRWYNWHQWRGPDGSGVARHGSPPIEWSEQKNIKWKVPIPGKGSGSPIVWKDRIFLLSAIETPRKAAAVAEIPSPESRPRGRRGGFGNNTAPTSFYQFAVICLDRETGRQLWRQVAVEAVPHEPGHATNTYASSSPVTNGEFVFASFGSRGLFCYDLNGELQWQRDLGEMQTRNAFGEGASPALYGDSLIVNWDHEGPSFIAALDARTGHIRWQVDRDEPTTWATPLIVEHGGRVQVVVHGTNRARAYDLATGEVIWECGGQATNPIASPIVMDGIAYCTTGHRGYATIAIPLSAAGDITDSQKVVWSRDDAGSYVASPTLYDGWLYFTKSRDAILLAVDAKTGETVIDESRLSGLSTLYASLVAADGRIYVVDRNGTAVVLRHAPQLEILATNQLDEGIDASPAIVGDQMFLRGEHHLYCIEDDGE